MKTTPGKSILLSGLMLAAMIFTNPSTARAADKLKALIIDGQNNHDWQHTTPIMKAGLENSGRFAVEVATTPPGGQNMDGFKPDFTKYDVIIFNYNGADWSPDLRTAFENYMKNGGGMVSVHAADNSFPSWAEYNKMTGVGGWNGRSGASGTMLRWRDGKVVHDQGGGGQHGAFFSWDVETREPEHPIMKGLPEKWLHTPDELYSTLVGPAENVTVLATAKSDSTGQNEPILMAISYGKGRVFHTTMGHNSQSVEDVGFITTLSRGAEWAATGKVTIKVPENFPTAEKTSVWKPTGN